MFLEIRNQVIMEFRGEAEKTSIQELGEIRFTPVDTENVGWSQDYRSSGAAENHRRYLEEGKYGVLAWHKSELVGYAWATISAKDRSTVNYFFRLDKGQALIHDCNVRTDWQGHNIYPAMVKALCQRLQSEDASVRILVDTARSNIASRRGLAKADFEEIGSGRYLQFRQFLLCRFQKLS